MSPAGFHFLPWVRYGVLATAAKPDTFDATLPPRLKIPVKLRVNTDAANDVSAPLTMYGPGDVIGIDPREVVRTVPRHLTPDFPPHRFACVEFDRPDFPWLFTPASPSATNRNALRPWIALAVVRKAFATITANPAWPLPKLTCLASELPDPTESWLWAHAVYTGSLDRPVDAQLAAHPELAVSRLLCPRRLQPSSGGPDAGYYACVVPLFEVGRKSGLAETPAAADATTLRPAWEPTASGIVQLPVYYHWEFDTGADGDFEDAVDRLQMLQEPPDTKAATMDATRPGGGIPDLAEPLVLPVPSAVRTGNPSTPPPPASYETLRAALRTALEAPPETARPAPPPIYGRWQASGAAVAGTTPLAPGAAPPWLRDLNMDPRARVAAALGARVVQQQQEQLVAAAWDQAGEARAVNLFLRQKQLGREVTRSVYEKRLAPLSSVALQQITSPAAITAIVRRGSETMAAASPAAATISAPRNPLVAAVTSPPFRRIARPFGPMSRQSPATAPRAFAVASATATVSAPMPTMAEAMTELLTSFVTGTATDLLQVVPPVETAPLAQSVAGTPTVPIDSGAVGSVVNVPTVSWDSTVRTQLDPEMTFAVEVQARVELPAALAAGRTDALAEVMFTPTFDEPMYEPLRELFPQMLLPGLERIPNNSIMLLDLDAAFIEAYMAGLNDEMSRELLWREFPTDLRGTYFRQFWDVRGQLAPAAPEEEREALRDIPRMAQWQKSLGSNMPDARGKGLLLLLLKGDLLTRFPTALTYAIRAKWSTGTPAAPIVDEAQEPSLPQVQLRPSPGVTLLGFNLKNNDGTAITADTVAGGTAPPADPGWFFVVEEHPTEPGFGLDISVSTLTTWRNLAWPDVAVRADGSGYISVRGRTPVLLAPASSAPKAEQDRYAREVAIGWGRDAAAMGYITLQRPFRQEIHAAYWFPRTSAV